MGTQIARIAHKTVRLTNAQIKALPTTAVEIVPAPGRNKVLQFLFGFSTVELNGAGYTNLTDGAHLDLMLGASTLVATPVLQKSSESRTQLADLLAGTSSVSLSPVTRSSATLDSSIAEAVSFTTARNKALNLVITGNSGDLTGGYSANVLDVTVYYVVLLRAATDLVATPASATLTVTRTAPGLGRTYLFQPLVGSLGLTGVVPVIGGGGKIVKAPPATTLTLTGQTTTTSP